MKKKMVRSRGMYFMYLSPRFGRAISSLTKVMIGSMKFCIPLGAVLTPCPVL